MGMISAEDVFVCIPPTMALFNSSAQPYVQGLMDKDSRGTGVEHRNLGGHSTAETKQNRETHKDMKRRDALQQTTISGQSSRKHQGYANDGPKLQSENLRRLAHRV
ncbi:hypothetical protein VFPPC_17740 [Pochonia chlamydosporia 170]|uniref:Uncharacterized protein n=1 Tax=Pochonia chlamydosporia 170 TaxID=1380566 RepID=A0A219AS19_METCM|nr:hypothetical protein VFPPC_17740 [Pochonia chlamydosporia 170]OWT43084.1 hypothetical protein VFPPC_17740 [Pochonia chlamydosporia 170]